MAKDRPIEPRQLAGMTEALRLTLGGRLSEATATIQRALGAAPGQHSFPTTPSGTTGGMGPRSAARWANRARGASAHRPLADRGSRGSARPHLAATLPDLSPGALSLEALGLPGWARHLPGSASSVTVGPSIGTRRSIGTGTSTDTGGRLLASVHAGPAGSRAYKLYVPRSYSGQAVPLVVMLHGCTQSPDDFAAGTGMNVLAERDGFLVVYPEQAATANGSKCWNWFKASDQERGQGEPAIIAGMADEIMGAYSIDSSRVYVAGLSAGGAMAAVMAATYPDLFAAAGVHSGLAYGAARDLPSALAAMRQGPSRSSRRPSRMVPLILFHGDQDFTVAPVNAERVLDQWLDAAGDETQGANAPKHVATVERGQVPHGHAFTRVVYEDANGRSAIEVWIVHAAGHAWSGGSARGSYTDPAGPDASAEMVRFFLEHPRVG